MAEAHLIPNRDFERGDVSDWSLDVSGGGTASYNLAVAQDESTDPVTGQTVYTHGGKYMLRIRRVGSAGGAGIVMAELTIPNMGQYVGYTLELSGWYRCERPVGMSYDGTALIITALDSGGGSLGNESQQALKALTWTYTSLTFTVPASTVSLQIQLEWDPADSGTRFSVYWDDLKLVDPLHLEGATVAPILPVREAGGCPCGCGCVNYQSLASGAGRGGQTLFNAGPGQKSVDDWYYPHGVGTGALTTLGNHVVMELDSGETCYIEVCLPRILGQIYQVLLVYVPTTSGTWDYTVDTSGGRVAGAEASDTHTDTVTEDGVSTTDGDVEAVDITDGFDLYEAGDAVGVEITADAFDTTTKINIIGIRMQRILPKV